MRKGVGQNESAVVVVVVVVDGMGSEVSRVGDGSRGGDGVFISGALLNALDWGEIYEGDVY